MKRILDRQYNSKLTLTETQIAIKFVKDTFQKELSKKLKLLRVSAPLFVLPKTGLNDNLSGKEEPVSFKVLHLGEEAEIVHSLAKWKRIALDKYENQQYYYVVESNDLIAKAKYDLTANQLKIVDFLISKIKKIFSVHPTLSG